LTTGKAKNFPGAEKNSGRIKILPVDLPVAEMLPEGLPEGLALIDEFKL